MLSKTMMARHPGIMASFTRTEPLPQEVGLVEYWLVRLSCGWRVRRVNVLEAPRNSDENIRYVQLMYESALYRDGELLRVERGEIRVYPPIASAIVVFRHEDTGEEYAGFVVVDQAVTGKRILTLPSALVRDASAQSDRHQFLVAARDAVQQVIPQSLRWHDVSILLAGHDMYPSEQLSPVAMLPEQRIYQDAEFFLFVADVSDAELAALKEPWQQQCENPLLVLEYGGIRMRLIDLGASAQTLLGWHLYEYHRYRHGL
jgi:hypothetical protein